MKEEPSVINKAPVVVRIENGFFNYQCVICKELITRQNRKDHNHGYEYICDREDKNVFELEKKR